MLAFLVVSLVLLAGWHLLCEGVIAPTWRSALRYRLFKCRDDLRWARITDDRLTDETFDYVQHQLNAALTSFEFMHVSEVVRATRVISRDGELQQILSDRRRMVQTSSCPIVVEIDREVANVLNLALAANTIGWFIYLVPVLIVKHWLWRPVRQIASLTDAEARRLFAVDDADCPELVT